MALDIAALLQGTNLGQLLQGQPVVPGQQPPAAPPQGANPPSVLDQLAGALQPAGSSSVLDGGPTQAAGVAPQGAPAQPQPAAAPQGAPQPPPPMGNLQAQQQAIANRASMPFLKRLGIPETYGGESFYDRLQDAGNQLQDGAEGTDRADRTQQSRLARQQQEYQMENQRTMMGQAAQLFPGDPKMSFLARYAPAEFAKLLTPQVVGFNQRLVSPMSVSGAGGAGGAGAQGAPDPMGVAGQELKDGQVVTYHNNGTITAIPAPMTTKDSAEVQHWGNQDTAAQGDLGVKRANLGIEGQKVGLQAQTVGQGAQKIAMDKVNEALARHPGAVVVNSQADLAKIPRGRGTTIITPDGSAKVW